MLNRSTILALVLGICGLAAWSGTALAGKISGENKISGEYLEIRSCSVYTGPCFANAEMGVTGREALMAISAGETLGRADRLEKSVKAVILADEKASPQQREALVDFVKSRAGKLAENVHKVEFVAIDLKLDHVDMVADLKA